MLALAYEHIKEILVVLASLSLIVEITPIKLNPWSAILAWIGHKCNKDLYERINRVEDSVKDIINANNEREAEKQDREAKKMRSDIIRFASRARMNHTVIDEWEFKDIFNVIDDYESYCKRHNIPNHYIDEQVEFIHEIYNQDRR